MTPEQIESTIEFILQSEARAAARMERFDEELREQKTRIDGLLEISRNSIEIARNSIEHNERMEEIVRNVTKILAMQAARLDRLEDQR